MRSKWTVLLGLALTVTASLYGKYEASHGDHGSRSRGRETSSEGFHPSSDAGSPDAQAASTDGTTTVASGDVLPPDAASVDNCPQRFLNQGMPSIPGVQAKSSVVRCRLAYVVLHNSMTRTPLWSAELLTPASIGAARNMERVDDFRPDTSINAGDRSELIDYRRSGWDRGHMSPSGDMPTADAQAESFELSNIVPQAPALNRGPWSSLESAVRRHAMANPVTYVVTGVLFQGDTLATLPDGRVAVPTSCWKAVAIPGRGSVVMVALNQNGAVPAPMSLAQFRQQTGIDPFPSISPADRDQTLELENGR